MILVTGDSGFVGGNIIRTLHNRFPITGASRRGAHYLDLAGEESEIEAMITTMAPAVIIHSAAIAQPVPCEENPTLAFRVNTQGTEYLIRAAQKLPYPPLFLYLSTDLVFDGAPLPTSFGFSETDDPCPRSQYAQSKYQAELLLRKSTLPHAVVRLSLVFGREVNGLHGFLGWMKKMLIAGEACPAFFDEWRTPLFVDDLSNFAALLIQEFMETNASPRNQLYHLSGSARVTRVELGEIVANILHVNPQLLKHVSREAAPGEFIRPADVSLNHQRAYDDYGYTPTPLIDALRLSLITSS